MNKKNLAVSHALAALAALTFASPAAAQATRTWVSGNGDDANPCSRTAPCKTFVGALSKTAAGGEINCIDAGGYGPVTINKSLTIDCKNQESGVLAGGTNGVVVNAGVNDKIALRGLDIFGTTSALNGVSVMSAASVSIEDSQIRNFTTGVRLAGTIRSNLYLSNVLINHNTDGVVVTPTGAGVVVSFTAVDTRVFGNSHHGIAATTSGGSATTVLTLNRVTLSGNGGDGINLAATTGNMPAMFRDTVVSLSGNDGIHADGSKINLYVGNSQITGSGVTSGTGTGVNFLNGASVTSFGDNYLVLNRIDGAFSATIGKK